MLKLVYDVKCGFEDLFITEKNIETDLASVIEANIEALETDIPDEDAEEFKLANPITEEDFYELYKDDLDGLLQFLEDTGYRACEEEANIEYYSKNYFAAICKEEKCLPGYYEDFNYRLVYEPNVKSEFYFYNAMTAKEVFDFLGINKQQLHYYVKTGKIKREYNNDATELRYNKADVYKLYNDQFNKKAEAIAKMTGCSYDEAVKQLLKPKDN